jgi:hypothetical protein
MRKFTLAAAIVAIAFGSISTGAMAKRKKIAQVVATQVVPVFKAADIDQSRSLSSTEFTAAGGKAANFDLIDANNNGELGIFELIRAAVARYMALRD